MAWNQPGNNRHSRDPWGDNSSSNSGGNSNNDNQNKKPLDFYIPFYQWRKKLCAGWGNYNKQKSVNRENSVRIVVIVALVVAAVTYVASGFYTIREAERGVVTRFGKLSHIVQPGLNWKIIFIDKVQAVNIESVRELAAAGVMLTSDENVIRAEMNVQYRVTDPSAYLFSVTHPDDTLRQATDAAVRGVIGKYTMDKILTEGRTIVRSDTQRVLEDTIRPYKMGITLLDVNFQVARPPEEVKAAFDDAIAARENEQQYIREAEAYANEVQPRANGQAERLLEDSKAYASRTVLEAQGEVASFSKLLEEYQSAPAITRKRLYIEAMERVLSNTRKVLINDKGGNIMVLPLEQILRHTTGNTVEKNKNNHLPNRNISTTGSRSQNKNINIGNISGKMIEQNRDSTPTRVGRE